MRRALAAAALALLPGPAAAHDAFGDMGPFYASLLHPLADPAQGLVLAGVAVLLVRQPLATVRPAYAALALAGAAGAVLAALGSGLALPQAGVAALACLFGAVAVTGVTLPPALVIPAAGGAGAAAGLALSAAPEGLRDGALALLGGAAGVALAPLLLWGLFDLAVRRIGPVAGAVAGSWIAAVGIMTAALGA